MADIPVRDPDRPEHPSADIARRAQAGDNRARDQLIRDHLWLVRQVTRKYNFGAHQDDLFQVGSIALLRALRTFNPDAGYAFSTYAKWWVRRDVQRLAWGDKRKQAYSLDAPVGADNETLGVDMVVDPNAVDPFEAAVEVARQEVGREAVPLLALLSPKEARVMELRWGLPASSSEPVEGTVAFDAAVLVDVCLRGGGRVRRHA